MRSFLFSLTAALCACGILSLTVEVPGGSSECFVLELTKGASFSGNFEVLTPDFNLENVAVKITGPAPHHTSLYSSSGVEEGSFSLEAADEGDQVLCLTNADAAASLTLGFAFRSDGDLLVGEMATEEHVKSMIQVANELTQGLGMLSDHQEFMRVREDMHRKTVAGTNNKLIYWSIGEAVILLVIAIWQITYIRTFFETKRSI